MAEVRRVNGGVMTVLVFKENILGLTSGYALQEVLEEVLKKNSPFMMS